MPTIEYLRAPAGPASPVGVDEKNKVVRGVVLAAKGDFFTGRGAFDDDSLRSIARLANAVPLGTKSRYGHPNPAHPGSPDELDGFLGRVKNAYPDGDKTRGDLHLDPVAFLTPPGGGTSRGDYLMARAKSDPQSFAMSLVLAADRIFRLDTHAKPKRSESGEILPPIWRPTEIHAVDVVDHGDSTPDGMLTVAERNIDGDELLRLRHDWRRKVLAGDPTDVDALRLRWNNAKRKAGVESLADGAGDNTIKAGGFVPAGPPHGAGIALPGPFRAPTLADFTARSWSALSEADRRKIAGWYAYCSSLDSFSNGLHLPFRFVDGSHRGRASLNGVRAALARLNQTAAIPAAKRDDVAKFLRSFLPGLGYR